MNADVRYNGVIQRMHSRFLSSSLESAIRWRDICKKMTNPECLKLARSNMRKAALQYKYHFQQL